MSMRGGIIVLLLLSFFTFFCKESTAQKITWSEHIAPVIHSNCTPCHRQGEGAPFSLVTYEDVAKRASFIKKVTQTRYMPPWMPDPHYVSFTNERKLTDEQIAMIADWADHKMPKGKSTGNDENNYVAGTRYNRKPDLVLSMKTAFHVEGDNTERFVVYKIPFELPDSTNVEAIEFITNNRKVVHHANFEVDAVPELDIYHTADYMEDAQSHVEYYEQYVPYRTNMIYFGGWVPGSSYESYPANMGWIMPKRGVVLLTVHYAPLAKPEDVINGVQFFFTKTPVKRHIQSISFGSGGVGEKQIDPYFYIPPGVVKSFKVKVATPTDQSLLYVWPHMHYLGKIFKAYAVTPSGDTIRLVSIPDWNFNWQEIYWFPKLMKIPAGTVVTIEGTYDNTADNPMNQSSPPATVYGAMRSKDEMLTLVVVSLPYEDGDEEINVGLKK
ncbi:hypothetical protein SAMN05518672_104631 [Chitinophaga sp. CF118]|uniref:c-type cytochrome n=1 Tax=Chitinophaga sp. CF118 TaxID=1884367 RepID=UPI0008E0E35A|nr:cytochrome c [Chitinophaga sp. CF118]SFE14057.1 hypothetical protein SAMN05518672_104631 [Chitinophaga sp. CF118]